MALGLQSNPVWPQSAETSTPHAALLILRGDDAEAATRHARIKSSSASLEARRRAVCLARHEAFKSTAAPEHARLLKALPAAHADDVSLHALPLLNAWLAYLPRAHAKRTQSTWHTMLAPKGGAVYRLGDIPDVSLPREATPLSATVCGQDAHAGTTDASQGQVLGIIDSVPDLAHPTLRAGLGRVYLQADGRAGDDVTDRHGTAMLGIYAQAAEGKGLSSQGHPLPARVVAPIGLRATLVAVAGPETPAGQARFAHALHWLVAAEDGRPFPDLLNYSRGNGVLCIEQTDAACGHDGGTGITRLLDRAIDDYALVAVKSAGNKHWGATQTMTAPGATWNGLAVGNMHPFDWQRCGPGGARKHHKIYRTSSVGAAQPRLIDLVAPGVRIDTAAPGNGQMLSTGTSPAAAVVGVVALRLMQTGLDDPMRIKAVLLNSADSWTSANAPSPAARGHSANCDTDAAAPRHGPYRHGAWHDRTYGWGYLNEQRALAEARFSRTGTLAPGKHRCFAVAAEPYDKFTLAWLRTPASPALTLRLMQAEEPFALIDEDREPGENLLQVSNGRGKGTDAKAGRQILVVGSAAPVSGRNTAQTQSFALGSARALKPLRECPAALIQTP